MVRSRIYDGPRHVDTDTRRGSTFINLGQRDDISPRKLLRIERVARELRVTDQILSVDLDTVSVEPTGPAPAWTSLEGDKISFSHSHMPEPDGPIDIAVWLGTNAHELGHVLFSPRKASTLMYRVLEAERTFLTGIAQLHNIAEDQREERLLLSKFRPWAGYLVAALSHHLSVKDDTSWLLIAGRTWLPQSVRDNAKALMVAKYGQHVTDEVTRIIGEYQFLTDPGDTECDEAWQLLQELHAMFGDDMPKLPKACTVMEGGEPQTGQPGDDVPPTAIEADGDPSDSDDGDGSDGKGDGGGDGKGSESDDGDSSESAGGTGAGSQGRNPNAKPEEPPSMKDLLRRAAKKIIDSDEEAVADLESVMDAVDFGRVGEAQGEERMGQWVDPSDRARGLHREVGEALLDLKDDCEPGWNKRVESGRLNVRRLLNPNTEADELFDRYDPGMMDAAELDVVLLLDISGSMGAVMTPLAEATWAIMQSVDDLEGKCTVFTWDSGPHRVLANGVDRPDGRMFLPQCMGGTNPTSALLEAYRLLAASQATNKLLVILTDGAWSGHRADNIIHQMRIESNDDIVTVCALLGSLAGDNGHNCQHVARIDDPTELAHLFRRVAAERIASWR